MTKCLAQTAPMTLATPFRVGTRVGTVAGRGKKERRKMKEPVDHILRPRLPWRSDEGSITECGYDAAKVKSLSREEFFQRLKDCGQQRTAMLTCMTCSDTAKRWATWEEDPRQALNREITWEHGGFYRARDDRGERLKDELIAIADLVNAHLDEFAARIAERQQRREWIEKKAAADEARKRGRK